MAQENASTNAGNNGNNATIRTGRDTEIIKGTDITVKRISSVLPEKIGPSRRLRSRERPNAGRNPRLPKHRRKMQEPIPEPASPLRKIIISAADGVKNRILSRKRRLRISGTI